MYYLFAGNNCYPDGGWSDYQGSYRTVEDALSAFAKLGCDWCQIVAVENLTEVCYHNNGEC